MSDPARDTKEAGSGVAANGDHVTETNGIGQPAQAENGVSGDNKGANGEGENGTKKEASPSGEPENSKSELENNSSMPLLSSRPKTREIGSPQLNVSSPKTMHSTDGEDTDSESDEDDDEPPTFKYTRLKGLPHNFFTTHPVSTATFSENVFVFGTHTGLIHLAHPDLTVIRTFKAHNASVLSLYTDGHYFSSGSMDGTVVIGSVLDEKDIVKYDFQRPVHAVVLDKNYQKSKTFVYGGMSEDVTLCSRNWLDQRVDTVLDLKNGPIVALDTIDDLIFWMNDKGITFYHVPSRLVISVIANPSDSFRSDLYWPRISFPETDRVLIAWGSYIWSLRISIKTPLNGNSGAGSSIKSRYFPAATLSFRAVQEKKVEVEHVFKVDFLISGIASFKDDYWLLLAYNPPEKDEETGLFLPRNPDIKLLSSIDGSTQYEEEIGLDTAENLGLNDYHLGHYIGDSGTRYYIFSARGGVIAEQVQLNDRLQWYLERSLYYKAWEMSQHVVAPEKRLGFGIKHLEELVLRDEWTAATEWIKKLLSVENGFLPLEDTKSTLATGVSSVLKEEDKEILAKEIASQWSLWSAIFMRSGHVEELASVIPTDPRWNLPKGIYCDILKYYLHKEDSEKIYELLNSWDLDLYDVKEITATMEEILEKRPNDGKLRRQLCLLYERTFEPSKAVAHLEKLQDPNIIPFLASSHILPAFVADIPKFAKFRFPEKKDFETLPISTIQTKLEDITRILVDSRHEISPNRILKLMFENGLDIINYFYLEELLKIDELLVKGYEDNLIKLYSQFNRPKLLPFLTASNNYNISEAIEVCEQNAFVDELVYLLSQVGENRKALTLILQELDDPNRAISFAKSQNDQEIWNVVLEHSFSRPRFIRALIESADEKSLAFYNPITILQNMDPELEVEGLKDSVTLVTRDNDMNLIVNQLIYNIVSKRSEKVSKKLYHDELRGVHVDASNNAIASKFNEFQPIALRMTSVAGEVAVVRLDVDMVYRLYTSLQDKLEHIKKVRAAELA